MFGKIKLHFEQKKHPYTVIATMFLLIGSLYIFNAKSDLGIAIKKEPVVAQVSYAPLQPLPGSGGVVSTGNTVGYLQNIIFLVIGIAIVLAVLMLVIGGVQYMASDAFTQKEDAKDRMTMAIFGLIIALGAYLLLNTINPDLVTFRLPSAIIAPTPPTLPKQPSSQQALESVRSGAQQYVTGKDLLGREENVLKIKPFDPDSLQYAAGRRFEVIVTGNAQNEDVAATERACKELYPNAEFGRANVQTLRNLGTTFECKIPPSKATAEQQTCFCAGGQPCYQFEENANQRKVQREWFNQNCR